MSAPRSPGETSERAAALNRWLYQDNPDLPWELAGVVDRQIEAICGELSYEEEPKTTWRKHRYRLAATLRDLQALLVEGMSVLELGGSSVVSYLLRAHFPGVEWSTSDWDLRLPWPTEDGAWDFIVMTEVLEHLSDPPDEWNDMFSFRGADNCLRECLRSLRPGGGLFLTTPNSASVLCLHQLLNGETGMYFHRHVREYSGAELRQALESAGFIVESQRAVHCLHLHEPIDFTPLFELLLAAGSKTEDRGDDWFVTAGKPAGGGSSPADRDRTV